MPGSFVDRMPAWSAFAICFAAYQALALVMGSGAALLLLPRSARRDALAFAPVAGFAVMVLAGWYLMFLGPPGTNRSWPWLVGIGAALAVAGVALRRRQLREALDLDVLKLAASAIAGVVLYAYLTTREPHLTAAAQNNDITYYSTIERQLQDLPGDAARGPADQFGLVQFARITVTGAFLPTAHLASILRVRTYQLQTVSIASYLFWGALLAGVFALRVLGFKPGGAMLVSLLAGTAQVSLYTAGCAYKSSLAGTALMLALLLTVLPALGAPQPERPLARAPLVALFGFALAMDYPHMVPIVWAVLGALAAARAVTERRWAPVRDGAALLALGLVGAAALSSERVWTTISYVFEMKATNSGIPMSPFHLPALLGFSGLGPDWAFSLEGPGRAVAGLAAAALVLWGLRQAFLEDRVAAVTAAALLVVIGLGYAVLWLTPSPNDQPGYKPFKLVSYFYPALLAAMLTAFRGLTLATWPGRLKSAAAAGLAVAVVAMSAGSAGEWRTTMPVATADAADLQRLELDPRIESINIVSSDFWEAMWQTGFLLRKPLSLKHSTYYRHSPRLDGAWDLEHVAPDAVLSCESPEAAPELPINRTYVLRGRSPAGLRADFGDGWSIAEPHQRWATAQRATLLVQSGKGRMAHLELQYGHFTPGTTFEVRLDDVAVGACPGPESCSVGPFEVAEGRHVLSFHFSKPPGVPGPQDLRTLETFFLRIHLFPAPSAEAPR